MDNENQTYYQYTGPKDSRDESWSNPSAYKKRLYKTPEGSIYVKHPALQMLCRVTDNPNLPGFIVSCKDAQDNNVELHVYYNPNTNELIACTSNKTNKEILDDVRKQIHRRYKLPFSENRYDEKDGPVIRTESDYRRMVARNTAAKVRMDDVSDKWHVNYFCPCCNTMVKQITREQNYNLKIPNFCHECGQELSAAKS